MKRRHWGRAPPMAAFPPQPPPRMSGSRSSARGSTAKVQSTPIDSAMTPGRPLAAFSAWPAYLPLDHLCRHRSIWSRSLPTPAGSGPSLTSRELSGVLPIP